MRGAPSDVPPVSWQRLVAARKEVARRWPSPLRLPLVHRPTDPLYAGLEGRERILDVGAGDAARRERIAARFPDCAYVSVDPDSEAAADHRSVADVEGVFDAAILFEVLEHVRPDVAIALLEAVRERLRPGGRLYVSVPATHTPGRYLRDCTHVTPWAHDELGAALVLAGFEVEALRRTFPGTFLSRAVRRFVLGPVGHLFGVDYAHSVVATARRPADRAPAPASGPAPKRGARR